MPKRTSASRGQCPNCGEFLPLPPEVIILPKRTRRAAPPAVKPKRPLPQEDRPQRLVSTMTGHKGPIRFATFSPDSRLLATVGGSEGGTDAGKQKFSEIRVWSANSGRQMASMQGHQDTVLSAAFTADSQFLVTGSKDHSLMVWDVSRGLHGVVTGLKVHSLRGHEGRVGSLVVTREGSQLISGSDDGTIRFWDTKTWRLVDTLKTDRTGLCQLALSADGAWLAAVWRSRGPAIVWDLAKRQEYLCLRLRPEEDCEDFDLAFSPDGATLAILSTHDVRLWDLSSCQVLVDIEAAGVRSLAFSPDGKLLATGGWDQKTEYAVQLWETGAGHELRRLAGHENSIYTVAYSPDGQRLASAGRDLTVRLWDPGHTV